MLKNRIIPCLDIKDGRIVKGINFENLIDAGDPVESAKFYYEQGADELCFLDIAATNENRSIMYEMVKKVANSCYIPFTVGGGIKSVDDFSKLMHCGADKVSINSAAINNENIISESAKKFGSQSVVIAIDAKKNNNKYEIFSHGGKKATNINAIKWAKKMQELGAGEILLTSINKDGTKQGYDLDLIKEINNAVNIPIIASGGVGNLEHLYDGIKAGADAVLAASIFHFKKYSIKEAKDYLNNKKVRVRI